LVAVGIAEILPELGNVIELVARSVLSEPIACILGEPVVADTKNNIAADAIADSKREDLSSDVRRLDMHDL